MLSKLLLLGEYFLEFPPGGRTKKVQQRALSWPPASASIFLGRASCPPLSLLPNKCSQHLGSQRWRPGQTIPAGPRHAFPCEGRAQHPVTKKPQEAEASVSTLGLEGWVGVL